MNLDFYDIITLFYVSKKFYKIKNNNNFWEMYYKKRFGDTSCGEFGYYPLIMNSVSNRWKLACKICDILIDKYLHPVNCYHSECIFANQVHNIITTPKIIVFGGFVRDYVCISKYFRNSNYYPIRKEFNDIDLFIDEEDWEDTLETIHSRLKKNEIMLSVLSGPSICNDQYNAKNIKFIARDRITNTKIILDISIGDYFDNSADFDVNSLYFKTFEYNQKPIISTKLIQSTDCIGSIIGHCQSNRATMEFKKKDILDNLLKKSDKISKRIEKMLNKGFKLI